MEKRNRPEILAPAGDGERLAAAVQYGADAVYLGVKDFGMRASPLNFTEEQLAQAVAHCHRQGVKVYVTCNILPRETDLAPLPGYLHFLQQTAHSLLYLPPVICPPTVLQGHLSSVQIGKRKRIILIQYFPY